MTSVRKLKRTYLRKSWFSKGYTLDGEYWPPARCGLAYGDVRGHTGVKRSHVGQRALIDIPYDDMHLHRKKCKKKEKEIRRQLNRGVRAWRRENHVFMECLTFSEIKSIYLKNRLHDLSPAAREELSRKIDEQYFFGTRIRQ